MGKIHFSCSECKAELSIDSRAAGVRVNCLKCRKPIVVPAAHTNFAFAGFGVRLAAFVIDLLVLCTMCSVAAILIFALFANLPSGSKSTIEAEAYFSGISFLISLASGIITWLYYTVSESSSEKATLGKRAFGLAVTDSIGGRISFARANGRYFSKVLSTLCFGIGYLLAAWTPKKQALHDMMSGCHVLKKPTSITEERPDKSNQTNKLSTRAFKYIFVIGAVAIVVMWITKFGRDFADQEADSGFIEINGRSIKYNSELDRSNGFKSLKFGMTSKQVFAMHGSNLWPDIPIVLTDYGYSKYILHSPELAKIGDFAPGGEDLSSTLRLSFLRDSLFAIELLLPFNEDELNYIIETFQLRYGMPNLYKGTSKMWLGKKVMAIYWEEVMGGKEEEGIRISSLTFHKLGFYHLRRSRQVDKLQKESIMKDF